MYPYRSKLGLSNRRDAPQVVAAEPWAEDFTLMPGEELEVIAYGSEAMPWFHVVEWDGTSQVYCEACASFPFRKDESAPRAVRRVKSVPWDRS
jgi:hypothetical protein